MKTSGILITALLSVTAFGLGFGTRFIEFPSPPYPASPRITESLERDLESVFKIEDSYGDPHRPTEDPAAIGNVPTSASGHVADSSAQHDEEWTAFSRNRRSIESFMIQAERTGCLDTTLLLRNVLLNRDDIPIDKSQRKSLPPVVQDLVRRMHALHEAELDYQNGFGRALVSEGRLEPLRSLPEPDEHQIAIIQNDLVTRLRQAEKSQGEKPRAAGSPSRTGRNETKIAYLHRMLADPVQAAGSYYFAPEGTWALKNSDGFFQVRTDRFPDQKKIDELRLYFRREFVGRVANYFEARGTLRSTAKRALLSKYFDQ